MLVLILLAQEGGDVLKDSFSGQVGVQREKNQEMKSQRHQQVK